MDLLFDSLLASLGLGAGLSGFSGLRAFLPLGLVGLISRAGLFGAFDLAGTRFEILQNPWVFGALLVLAVLEIIGDKIPLLDSAIDLLAWPVRILAGAVIFGAALAHQDMGVTAAGMVGGGAIAATANAVKSIIRPASTVTGGGALNPFISFFEDVTATLGTVVVMLLPILGLLLVAFLIFLVYRVRKIKQRKYKGLRILRE
jgi:uncharacterized membrane protein